MHLKVLDSSLKMTDLKLKELNKNLPKEFRVNTAPNNQTKRKINAHSTDSMPMLALMPPSPKKLDSP